MKLKCTEPAFGSITKDLTEDQLASLCLELNGGGYNEDQTRAAIEFQRNLLDGHKVTARGATWEIVE